MSAKQTKDEFWYTAQELADMALRGLPTTKRRINAVADRQGWKDSGMTRRRAGRGGGIEYHWSLLPDEAQNEIASRHEAAAKKNSALAVRQSTQSEPVPEHVTESQLSAHRRMVMEARTGLVGEIYAIAASERCSNRQAILRLIDRFKCGTAEPEIMRYAERAVSGCRSHPSARSLHEWVTMHQQHGAIALAPKPTKKAEPLPIWFDDLMRFHAMPSKPALAEALDNYRRSLSDPSEAPSYRQARWALSKLQKLVRAGQADKLALHRGREGQLALRKRLAFVSRDTSDLLPATVYIADGKTFDAGVAHPAHGKLFRPELTSILDVKTRVCVGWSVGLDENGWDVADALRRACERFGIPACFYADNGPGYNNETLDDTVTGFMARAGISKMNSRAYNAQAKGIIERFNQTYGPLAKRYPTYLNREMDREASRFVQRQLRKDLAETGQSDMLPRFAGVIDATLDGVVYRDLSFDQFPVLGAFTINTVSGADV